MGVAGFFENNDIVLVQLSSIMKKKTSYAKGVVS